MRIMILLTIFIVLCSGLVLAREFYQFPQVPDVQDRDIYLLRRPKATGFDNNTGSRNITGAQLRSELKGDVGPAGPPLGRWMGEWDSNTTYLQNDIVTYRGSTYRVK